MRRWLRRILILLGLLLVLLFFAPALADTAFVRARIERAIAGDTGLEISVGEVEAGWWSGLEVRGVRATIGSGEFAGSRLLAVDRASLAPGLLDLLTGPDAIDVEVSGLVVAVEERAGFRTSADRLLERFLEKPPVEPRPPVKRPPPEKRPSLRIRVTDSRLELRRLLYRPPRERINPFEKDVPIRPADAGLETYAIDVALLELSADAWRADLRAGEYATLRAELRRADGSFTGEIERFDLGLLQPFLEERLRGVVDLAVRGRYRPGRSHGRVELAVDGFASGEIEEEWIRGTFAFEEGRDAVRVGTIDLTSASGRFAASGALDFPRDEPHRPSGELHGRFPLAPVYLMVAGRRAPAAAQVRFDVTTNLSPEGGRVDGTVAVDDARLRFALQGERATRRLSIETLALRAGFARADLKGELVRPPRLSLSLSGTASGDLARLGELAGFEGSGRASLELRSLRYAPGDGVSIEAKGRGKWEAEFDGTFHDAFDRVELRGLSVGGLRLRGAAHGLRTGRPAGEGRLAGTADLARFTNARGTAAVDLAIASDGRIATAKGSVGVKELAWERWKDDDVRASVEVSWDGAVVRGSVDGTAVLGGFSARDVRWERGSFSAKGSLSGVDAARLPLLSEFTWTGRHDADFAISHAPGRTEITGTVRAPSVTFLREGRGLEGEKAELDAVVARRGDAWSFDGSELRVPGRALTAKAVRLSVRDGAWRGELRASARLEHLVPELRGPLDLTVFRGESGTIDAEAVTERATIEVLGAEPGETVRLPEVVVRSNGATLRASGTVGEVTRFEVASSGDDFGAVAAWLPGVEGSGPYEVRGDVVVGSRIAVKARGAVAKASRGEVGVEGMRFDVDADFAPARDALEDLRLKGTLRAARSRTAAIDVEDLTIETEGRGTIRRDGGGPGHRIAKLTVRAGRIALQDRSFETVVLAGRGVLHHADLNRADALDFDGDLSFARGEAVVLAWRDATARIRLDDHVGAVEDLRATAKGGRITGHARVDLRGAHVPWSVTLELEDGQLDADFADPLSYVLPILRLAGQKEEATGFVGAKVELAAQGTDWESVKRTLRGRGSLTLRDAEITGSLLMPLLSARLLRLLLNKPYRIPDGTMKWKVEDGVVTTEPLKLNGLPFDISLGGTVTLDGRLEYIVHPGLLLVPLRVTGHWGKLKVVPAPAEALRKWPWKK